MKFLTRFSLRNPVAILLIVLIIAVGGVLSAFRLKEEMMPNISIPIISVMTTYPGASPHEVANDITSPLEKALNGAKDVQSITSTSLANVSQIEIELNMSADLNAEQQNVQRIINQVSLPANAGKPNVQSFSFSNIPVLAFTVSGNLPGEQLKHVVNNKLVPALQGVSGVATVTTSGAEPDNVVIQFDPQKLAKYHLSEAQVLQELEADDVSSPIGSATVDGKVQPVQMNAALTSLQDIRNLSIPVPSNKAAGMQSLQTTLGDIGQSVGQVATGLGQVGQGLGLIQAETKLLSSLQQVQGQIFGAELARNHQLMLPKSQQNAKQIAQLQQEIQSLQGAQKKMQQQLNQLAAKMPTQAPAAGRPSVPSKSSQDAKASSSASAALDMIPLSDVATVALQPPASTSINRTNGERSIMLAVSKTEQANTVDVANGVNDKIDALQSGLPQGIHIATLFNSAKSVKQSVNGLLREAILGAVFAVLVILLFLRNWRTTLIAIVSIPISLLISILVLNRLGITLNIMSLGGLAVATGRVVDDSIVVIENIYRSWRTGLGFGKKLVLFGAKEVGTAILSSTLATIAVFLPLAMVSGVVGKIFFPFALTVVVSLVASLLVALTVVPLLAAIFVARKRAKDVDYQWAEGMDNQDGEGLLHPVLAERTGVGVGTPEHVFTETSHGHSRWQQKYQGMLAWCLNHKIWVVLVTAVAFAASIAVLPIVGSTFMPNSAQPTVSVSVKMPVGTPLDVTSAKAKQVEQAVETQKSAVQDVNTQVGSSGGYSAPQTDSASLTVELKPKADVNQFVTQLRARTKPLATDGAKIQVQEQQLGGSGTSFDVVVTGTDAKSIKQAAVQVTDALKDESGLTNVKNNLTSTQPQISIVPKSKGLAQYGLTAAQVKNVVKQYLAQQNIGTVTVNGQAYSLVATVKSKAAIHTLSAIEQLPIPTSMGKTITVGDVASVKQVQTPVSVLHKNSEPYAEITADYTTQSTGKVLKDAMAKIHSMKLPAGVQVQQSASSMQQSKSFGQLIEAILVAVGVVYLVMLITFGEWSAPFSILFSMPVALIGSFFGTVIGRQPVSVSSLIGILMLMGIVVTNAIVLIDRVEKQRRQGLSVRDALLEAGTTRLRPILMTAIATICALLPLAFGASEGALISQGLAVVVIGGLVTSTILTLCIVPLVYELLHIRIHRREQRALRS